MLNVHIHVKYMDFVWHFTLYNILFLDETSRVPPYILIAGLQIYKGACLAI